MVLNLQAGVPWLCRWYRIAVTYITTYAGKKEKRKRKRFHNIARPTGLHNSTDKSQGSPSPTERTDYWGVMTRTGEQMIIKTCKNENSASETNTDENARAATLRIKPSIFQSDSTTAPPDSADLISSVDLCFIIKKTALITTQQSKRWTPGQTIWGVPEDAAKQVSLCNHTAYNWTDGSALLQAFSRGCDCICPINYKDLNG